MLFASCTIQQEKLKMDAKVKVTLPHSLKPKVMLWADVSYNDMEEIDKTLSIPDLESVLCRALHIDIPEPKRGILLDLYVHTVLFCRERRFNREQTSTLLSITKNVHQANAETSLDNMEQCFRYCSELLLTHAVRRPPFSINLFSLDEMTRALGYLHDTYFRHYSLYKYAFTPQIRLDLSLRYSGLPEEDAPDTEDSALPADEEKVMESSAEEQDQPETQEPLNTVLEVTTPGAEEGNDRGGSQERR